MKISPSAYSSKLKRFVILRGEVADTSKSRGETEKIAGNSVSWQEKNQGIKTNEVNRNNLLEAPDKSLVEHIFSVIVSRANYYLALASRSYRINRSSVDSLNRQQFQNILIHGAINQKGITIADFLLLNLNKFAKHFER